MVWRRPTLQARPGSLFRFRVAAHRGKEVRLADGTVVVHGDRLVELHLDNQAMATLRRAGRYSAWKAIHELRLDLEELGRLAASGGLGPVVAFYGVSLAGEAGGVLGFESRELPHSLRYALVHYFLAGLDAIYHPLGVRRLGGRVLRRWPSEVWMSVGRAAVLARER